MTAPGMGCFSLLRRLRHARGGVAAVEFAVLAPVLVLLCTATIDFGYFLFLRTQLSGAVAAAAQYTFLNASTASTASGATTLVNNTTTVLQNAASASTAGLGAALTPNVVYNNGGGFNTYYCVSGDANGANLTWTVVTSSSTSCHNNGAAPYGGKFMTVGASLSFTPLFPGDRFLTGSVISDSVIVRLQ